MSRIPKPWWWKPRRAWFVQIDGRRHNLGPDRALAMQRYHELMAQPKQAAVKSDSALAVIDAFLEWTSKHRAAETYEWYRKRLQQFAESIPNLTVNQLKPYHVQQWIDKHERWSAGHRRGCIIAVQRAFRWAEKLGYIDRNPIRYIEKPPAGKREQVVTDDQYGQILESAKDDAFRDLVTLAWETGARPQELIRVEACHVDLPNARWVFTPQESKVKKWPRIVYLTETALAITQRLMLKHPDGPILRNSRGGRWKPFAVNCRFNRLREKLGGKFCLYNFRHTFATRLLKAGVDALTVAILLGHADVSMLGKVYQHLSHSPEHLLQQVRRIAG